MSASTILLVLVALLSALPALGAHSGGEGDPKLAEILRAARDVSVFDQPGRTPSERRLAHDRASVALVQIIREFLVLHQAGPERAEAVLAMAMRGAQFIQAIDPAYDANQQGMYITFDEPARAAHEAEVLALLQAVRADPTASPVQRTTAERLIVARLLGEAETWEQLDRLQERIDQLASEGLAERPLRSLQRALLMRSARFGAAAHEARINRLLASPVGALRAVAEQAKADLAAARGGLGDLKFTALDGRLVDLPGLRGKVVLVDFWATWCGPCIAELPHLKKVHAAYRHHGLEIVGITLENAGLRPDDTTEQVAARHDRAKRVLIDFLAKEGIAWPQYYDGQHWKNPIASRFAVRAIPALLLLDREGRLVTTDASGQNLETEVRRLLGL